MAATKKKKKKLASSCFHYLSAKFALFWFWSHPITKLETDIQKWLWPELFMFPGDSREVNDGGAQFQWAT